MVFFSSLFPPLFFLLSFLLGLWNWERRNERPAGFFLSLPCITIIIIIIAVVFIVNYSGVCAKWVREWHWYSTDLFSFSLSSLRVIIYNMQTFRWLGWFTREERHCTSSSPPDVFFFSLLYNGRGQTKASSQLVVPAFVSCLLWLPVIPIRTIQQQKQQHRCTGVFFFFFFFFFVLF